MAGEAAADAAGLHEQVLHAIVHLGHHAVLAGHGGFDAGLDFAAALVPDMQQQYAIRARLGLKEIQAA